MTQPGIEPWSLRPLANTLLIRLMIHDTLIIFHKNKKNFGFILTIQVQLSQFSLCHDEPSGLLRLKSSIQPKSKKKYLKISKNNS